MLTSPAIAATSKRSLPVYILFILRHLNLYCNSAMQLFILNVSAIFDQKLHMAVNVWYNRLGI